MKKIQFFFHCQTKASWIKYVFEYNYRKIPNISPGLIEVHKHSFGVLYSGEGLYSE